MSSIRKILFAAGALVLLLVIVGVFLPSTGHVQRQASIDAPAATVYTLINDFRRVREWSPRFDVERDVRLDYEGPAAGVGATVRWSGGPHGSGSETIVESVPFERVETRVERAGESAARTTFRLTEDGERTRVDWTHETDFGIDLLARYRGLLLERLVARDYETALANLKTMAERLPRADFSDLQVERLTVEPQRIAWLRTRSMPSAAAMSEAMGEAYFDILSFIDHHGLREAGPPLAISRSFSGSQIVFDAAIPVSGGQPDIEAPEETGVRLGITYGGPVVRAVHRGSYGNLGETHEKVAAYLAAHGIDRNGDAWESYASDPARTPEADLLTYVYYPVRPR